MTTVVVTSTITGLAADSLLGSGNAKRGGGASGRRQLAVLLILAGAAVSALPLRWHLGAGVALAGTVVLLATVVGELRARGSALSEGTVG